MRVTCQECLAVYKIPDEKITKDVCRATCKKCGAKIIIRRADAGPQEGRQPSLSTYGDEEVIEHEDKTVVDTVPELRNFDATPAIGTAFFPAAGATDGTKTPYAEPVPGLKMRKFDEDDDGVVEEAEVSVTPLEVPVSQGTEEPEEAAAAREPVAEPAQVAPGAEPDAEAAVATDRPFPTEEPPAGADIRAARQGTEVEEAAAAKQEAALEERDEAVVTERQEAPPSGAGTALKPGRSRAPRIPRPRASLPRDLWGPIRPPVSLELSHALRRTLSAVVFVVFMIFLFRVL